jgi:hypothetical protein
MIQYLLATYARDDELAKAYHAVSSSKQAAGEEEKAFPEGYSRPPFWRVAWWTSPT